MWYSERYDVAFLHIHKTAGTSMVAALREQLDDLAPMPELPDAHDPIAELFAALRGRGREPLDTQIVSAVCHPLVHAVSIYEFWRSSRIPAEERRLPHVARARALAFPEFVSEVLAEDQFAQHLAIDGQMPANVEIVRREALAADTGRFLSRVTGRAVHVTMPVLNRTDHPPIGHYMSDDTLDRLAVSYAWTFEQGWYLPGVIPEHEASSPATADGVIRRAIRRVRR